MKRRLIVEVSVPERWAKEDVYGPGVFMVTVGKLLEALPGLKVDYIKNEPIE